MMKDYNKILGCLVGGAAGDALGYAVEFDREKTIFGKYGKSGICNYELVNGKALISDDTQMTLFTAAGILLAKDSLDYTDFITGVHQAYKEWLMTQDRHYKMKNVKTWLVDIPEMNARRAPGLTCLNALRENSMGGIYDPVNNSKGCGGVMRVAPIGLFYDTDILSVEDIDCMGAGAAAITHGHPLGYISAAGLVHVVQIVSHDPSVSLLDAVTDMIEKVPGLYPDEEADNVLFSKLMKKAVTLAESDIPDLEAIHQLGEGWVAEEALAIAVYCALKYADNFDAALIASVNHNGDSDSTGAITGNILGAYLGYDKIPCKYTENLELLDVMERIAGEMMD